jgi:hypothetical protein
MTRSTPPTGRTEALLKAHVQNNKGRQHRVLLHQRAAARIRRENPLGPFPCTNFDAHNQFVGIGGQRQRVSPPERRKQTVWNARVTDVLRALLWS